MCLIIRAGDDSIIPEALVASAASRNKDGWGMMYHDGTKMYIRKSLDMKKLVGLLPKLKGRKALIHMRYATHGLVSYNNTHPYKVSDDVYFMHNGVMHKFSDPTNKDSDSKVFADSILTPLVTRCGPRVIIEPFFQQIVKEFCGYSNRFAFMNSFGDIVTVGEWSEDTDNKLWLSNTSAYDTRTCGVKSKFQSTYTPSVGSSGSYGNGYSKSKWELEREAREKKWREEREAKVDLEPLVKISDYDDDDAYFDRQWFLSAKDRQDAVDRAIAKDTDPVDKSRIIPIINGSPRESTDKEGHTESTNQPTNTGTASVETKNGDSAGKPDEQQKEVVALAPVEVAADTNYLESFNYEEIQDDEDEEYTAEEMLEMRAHALCDALIEMDIDHVSELRRVDVRDLSLLCEYEPDWMSNLIHNSFISH